MAINKEMTQKIKTYLHKNHIRYPDDLDSKGKEKAVKEIGCTKLEFAEYCLTKHVTK